MANKKWSELYAESPASLPLANTDIFCVTQGSQSAGLTSLELADSLNFLTSRGFVTVGTQAQFETIAEAFSAGYFKVLVISDITEIQNYAFPPSSGFVVCIYCLPNVTIDYNGFTPFTGEPTTEIELLEMVGGTHVPNSISGQWLEFIGGWGNLTEGIFYNFTLDLTGTDVSVGDTALFVQNSKFVNLNITYSGDDFTPQTVFIKCNLSNVVVTGAKGSSSSTQWGLVLQDSVISSVAIKGYWDSSLALFQLGGAIFSSGDTVVSAVNIYDIENNDFLLIVNNITGLTTSFSLNGKIYVLGDSTASNIEAQGSSVILGGSTKLQNCKFKNIIIDSIFSSITFPYGPSFLNVEFFDSSLPVSTDGMVTTPISFSSCFSKQGFVINSDNASLVNCVANQSVGSTITVQAGSTNTILIGNKTLAAIVDNGTNTESFGNQLIV